MTLREAALAENPLIAILRGLEPENAIAVADVLVDAGFKFIEVPLNSPEPLKSIRLIADKYGKTVVVGAGTVLSPDDVELGAAVLKFFPAEYIPPAAIRAMRAVLPTQTVIAIVGGITPTTMDDYLDAGANSFGLGSALFKPDYSIDELQTRATAFVDAFNKRTQQV